MSERNKKSYLTLIHHILQLLFLESKLKHKIVCCESDLDGMEFYVKDSTSYKERLMAVQQTLKRISLNHEDLIALLRERLDMKCSLNHRPFGNAGYYRMLKIKDRLKKNKEEISLIIESPQMNLGI